MVEFKNSFESPDKLIECINAIVRKLDVIDRDAQIYLYNILFQMLERTDKACILSALFILADRR